MSIGLWLGTIDCGGNIGIASCSKSTIMDGKISIKHIKYVVSRQSWSKVVVTVRL